MVRLRRIVRRQRQTMSMQVVQPTLFTNRGDCPVDRSSSPTARFSGIFRDFPNTSPPRDVSGKRRGGFKPLLPSRGGPPRRDQLSRADALWAASPATRAWRFKYKVVEGKKRCVWRGGLRGWRVWRRKLKLTVILFGSAVPGIWVQGSVGT